jgi:hypothetical protein
MPANPDSQATPQPDRLEIATDQVIAACGGNARNAVKALLVTNEFLEAQIVELQAAISNGYARGKFEPVPRDRKDWYDRVEVRPWPGLPISLRCRSMLLTAALLSVNPSNVQTQPSRLGVAKACASY